MITALLGFMFSPKALASDNPNEDGQYTNWVVHFDDRTVFVDEYQPKVVSQSSKVGIQFNYLAGGRMINGRYSLYQILPNGTMLPVVENQGFANEEEPLYYSNLNGSYVLYGESFILQYDGIDFYPEPFGIPCEFYFDVYPVAQQSIIQLEEYVMGANPMPLLPGGFVNGGVKVSWDIQIPVINSTYFYTKPDGRIISAELENNFVFWQKGSYTVLLTNALGITSSTSFTIEDFDMILDPLGTVPGTEVSANGGARYGKDITVGYTRLIYFDDYAPSRSRLDYTYTISNPQVAKVTAYGTIEAKNPGFVIVTATYKHNPALVTNLLIRVLP